MADFDILGKILAESQFLKACWKRIQGNWVAFINVRSHFQINGCVNITSCGFTEA